MTSDLKGWESLLPYVLYLCTQLAQGINQDSYGTVLHALGTSNHMGAAHHAQVGRHKSHGGTGSFDINFVGHVSQRLDNHLGIVAITQVLRQITTSAKGIDNERTVGYAF